jgi:hypothetical protein
MNGTETLASVLDTFEEVRQSLRCSHSPAWFRGHSDEHWLLEPTLLRYGSAEAPDDRSILKGWVIGATKDRAGGEHRDGTSGMAAGAPAVGGEPCTPGTARAAAWGHTLCGGAPRGSKGSRTHHASWRLPLAILTPETSPSRSFTRTYPMTALLNVLWKGRARILSAATDISPTIARDMQKRTRCFCVRR